MVIANDSISIAGKREWRFNGFLLAVLSFWKTYLLGLLNEALGNVIFIGCLNAG
jgi:hypothetical protein